MSKRRAIWARRLAGAAVLPIAVMGVTGCEADTVYESGVDLEDPDAGFLAGDEESDGSLDSGPYDEVYDQSFYDELTIYFGEEVTLSAAVGEVLGTHSFTIRNLDEATVEPLLVISADPLPELTPGDEYFVNGSVYEYLDVAAVEDELGITLEESVAEDWENDPYLLAESVQTTPVTGN